MGINFDLESGSTKRLKIKDSHLLWQPLNRLNVSIIAIMMVLAFLKIFKRPEFILITIMLGLVLFLLMRINAYYEKQGNVKNNFRWHVSYPIVLVLFVIQSFYMFTPNDTVISFNNEISAIDASLFGRTPAVYLEQLLNPIVVDFFYLIYFGFYLAPLIFVARLYMRHRRDDLKLSYLALTLTLYLVLMGYYFIPVTGPAHLMTNTFNHQVIGFYLTGIVPSIQALIEPTQFNAFPSIHAAATIVLLILSYKLDKHFFWRFLPFALLVQFSGIYLRYYFGVSMICGYAIGLLAWIISSTIFNSKKYRLVVSDNQTSSF